MTPLWRVQLRRKPPPRAALACRYPAGSEESHEHPPLECHASRSVRALAICALACPPIVPWQIKHSLKWTRINLEEELTLPDRVLLRDNPAGLGNRSPEAESAR